ncbi:MAG: hypothetical protein M1817_002700 [Caeruleum heppii]|nr:MAG: hypothetical protein M1817_002700 [Caeruleum heppii]
MTSPSPLAGTVSGHTVQWLSSPPTDDESSEVALSWRYVSQDASSEDHPVKLPREDGSLHTSEIICVYPRRREGDAVVEETKTNNYEVLLYNDSPPPQAESASSPSPPHLQTLLLTSPPPSFLSAYLLSHPPSHLSDSASSSPSQPTNLHVVLSTHSGSRRARSVYDGVVRPLLERLGFFEGEEGDESVKEEGEESQRTWTWTLHITQNESSVQELSQNIFGPRARRGIRQTILILSGDGGIHDLVEGLSRPPSSLSTPEETNDSKTPYIPPTLCILPLGTANALAHSLRLTSRSHPHSLTPPLRTILTGIPEPLPTFTARFSPGARILSSPWTHTPSIPLPRRNNEGEGSMTGVVVMSYGLHATLVAESDSPAWRERGSERFGLVAKRLMFPPNNEEGGKGGEMHRWRATVSLLSSSSSSTTTSRNPSPLPEKGQSYILTPLVSHLESTFPISPASDPSNPSLRLLQIPSIPAAELAEILGKVYEGKGRHVDDRRVRYVEVEGVRVDVDEEKEGDGGGGGGGEDMGDDKEEGKEEDGDDGEWRWRRVCVDGVIVLLEQGGWVEVRRDWKDSLSTGQEGEKGVRVVMSSSSSSSSLKVSD